PRRFLRPHSALSLPYRRPFFITSSRPKLTNKPNGLRGLRTNSPQSFRGKSTSAHRGDCLMAANAGTPIIGKRKHHRRRVMSEINVTPMVDVMLVLLIIFMVSAPLLTVGVPIDLPQSQAKSLDQDKEPLTVSINDKGQIFLQNSEIAVDDLIPKMQAVAG